MSKNVKFAKVAERQTRRSQKPLGDPHAGSIPVLGTIFQKNYKYIKDDEELPILYYILDEHDKIIKSFSREFHDLPVVEIESLWHGHVFPLSFYNKFLSKEEFFIEIL